MSSKIFCSAPRGMNRRGCGAIFEKSGAVALALLPESAEARPPSPGGILPAVWARASIPSAKEAQSHIQKTNIPFPISRFAAAGRISRRFLPRRNKISAFAVLLIDILYNKMSSSKPFLEAVSAFGQYGIIALKNLLLSAFGISAAPRQEQMKKCGTSRAPFEPVGGEWGCQIGSGLRRLPRRNSGKWRRFGK